VIARVLCATAQSEQAAVTMAELWGEQVGRFERTAPGFQGAVLLREGAKLLAVSCWEGRRRPRPPLSPCSTGSPPRSWRPCWPRRCPAVSGRCDGQGAGRPGPGGQGADRGAAPAAGAADLAPVAAAAGGDGVRGRGHRRALAARPHRLPRVLDPPGGGRGGADRAARAGAATLGRRRLRGAGVAAGPAELAGAGDRPGQPRGHPQRVVRGGDRRRHEKLSGAARSLDAAAFRARYRLS
jgi:hypothetical protein